MNSFSEFFFSTYCSHLLAWPVIDLVIFGQINCTWVPSSAWTHVSHSPVHNCTHPQATWLLMEVWTLELLTQGLVWCSLGSEPTIMVSQSKQNWWMEKNKTCSIPVSQFLYRFSQTSSSITLYGDHTQYTCHSCDVPKGILPCLSFTKVEIWPHFNLLSDTADSKVSSCLRSTIDKSIPSMSALFSLTHNFHHISWPAFIIHGIDIASLSLSLYMFSFYYWSQRWPSCSHWSGMLWRRDPFPICKYTLHANKFV